MDPAADPTDGSSEDQSETEEAEDFPTVNFRPPFIKPTGSYQPSTDPSSESEASADKGDEDDSPSLVESDDEEEDPPSLKEGGGGMTAPPSGSRSPKGGRSPRDHISLGSGPRRGRTSLGEDDREEPFTPSEEERRMATIQIF